MSRTLSRSIARKHYAKFAKAWRDDLRSSGLFGKKGSPKRPRFNQWYAMHMHDLEMTSQSTPQDVQEYLGGDPWAEEAGSLSTAGTADESDGNRGVVTIDMATGKAEDE